MSIQSNPNEPTFCFDSLPLHWQMTRCEKFAFTRLLEQAAPDVAIEIGTYKGGSLQSVSKYAQKVYSLDINPECKDTLSHQFNNVSFITDDSQISIPKVLEEIANEKRDLGFVLIDGDHSCDGARGDANAILKHKPTRDLYLVFHDSFNPDVREGILTANWQDCPYVHYVEIDFIPGVFHQKAFDTAPAGSMYGGLAVVLLKPQHRDNELVIHQSQKGLFDAVLEKSCYVPQAPSESQTSSMPPNRVKPGLLSQLKNLFGPSTYTRGQQCNPRSVK